MASRHLHRPRPRLLAATALAATLALAPTAAGAHGPEGEATIIAAEQVGDDAVRVEVGILYANDGDLAEDAEAVATLTADDGTTVGPVDLPRIRDARYGAEVQVPAAGTWQVEVASTGPEAEATGTVEVVEEEPTTTTTTSTTTTTAPPTTAAADDVSAASEVADDAEAGDAALVALGAAVVAAAVAGGILLYRRSRSAR